MFNLFRQPIEKTSLEAWAKLADDVAKVAILAIPVTLYGNYTWCFKMANCISLVITTYVFLITGRIFRRKVEGK